MGGHGGLNILPQKRWNVYGYENREKVKRDEEEAAEEERRKRDRQIQIEGEARRQVLLERAHKRSRRDDSVALEEVEAVPAAAQHVDLFAAPPEVVRPQAEGKAAPAKKNPLQDEDPRLKLGAGLAGQGVQQPWYARPAEEPQEQPKEAGANQAAAQPSRKSTAAEAPVKGEAPGKTTAAEAPMKGERLGSTSSKRGKARKSVEELRAERLARERHEKERQQRLLVTKAAAAKGQGPAGLAFQAGATAPPRRYNSGFGYGR